MNRKRSAVLAAVAIAAPLVTIVSTPASAAPGQFCQVNCYNSGYRYVLDKTVRGLDDDLVNGDGNTLDQTLFFYCDGPGPDLDPTEELDLDDRSDIDSLDADQAAASINAAFAVLSGMDVTPRIVTDNRARPVGIAVTFDDDELLDGDIEDANGFDFQIVCLDDRDPVTP